MRRVSQNFTVRGCSWNYCGSNGYHDGQFWPQRMFGNVWAICERNAWFWGPWHLGKAWNGIKYPINLPKTRQLPTPKMSITPLLLVSRIKIQKRKEKGNLQALPQTARDQNLKWLQAWILHLNLWSWWNKESIFMAL